VSIPGLSTSVGFDLLVPGPEEMSRDELVIVVAQQAGQIRMQAETIAQLMEANEALADKLARLEHLLSRNSGNSSAPPSRDGDPGKPPAPEKKKRRGQGGRSRGKQPGAPGSHLALLDDPDERCDRFPTGRCGCGANLTDAADLGVVDSYQQHEIPQVAVRVTQYDQHQVRCGCGQTHTAARPDGARPGPVGYGPNLAAFAVYLLVVHFLPTHRVVALLESLTGAAPSVGFVHSLLARTAGLLGAVHARIRTLITLAYAVCVDETPVRVGPRTPRPGKTKAERYLLVACTQLYTHYLLGDRSLDTFKASVLAERAERGALVVHDRYQNYDNVAFGGLVHQLCCAHLLRDLDDAAQVYPKAIWPGQIADALRGLIHEANLARDTDRDQIAPAIRDTLTSRFRHGVRVGLSDTRHHGSRPGERKARLLLQVLRDRQADVLRFAHDLAVPPTSNQAERDLRPAKCQQNVSGRLTSEQRTRDRYTIRGFVSTAIKHGLNPLTALRETLLGQPWMPDLPATT
jgi:transposase